MTNSINRRDFLAGTAGAGLAAAAWPHVASAQTDAAMGIDPGVWTPQYIESIAGTARYDTVAECAKVVPLDYKGHLTYWYNGPNQASPQIEHEIDAQFWAAFAKTYPNITVEKQNLDYNGCSTSCARPRWAMPRRCARKLPIMWGVEFAAKGQVQELKPEDVGYPSSEFWPGAMKSVTWQGKTYGVPTNNETMALIWNADAVSPGGTESGRAAGNLGRSASITPCRSRKRPARTATVWWRGSTRATHRSASCRNAGHIGGGALDEAEPHPTYQHRHDQQSGIEVSVAAVIRHV